MCEVPESTVRDCIDHMFEGVKQRIKSLDYTIIQLTNLGRWEINKEGFLRQNIKDWIGKYRYLSKHSDHDYDSLKESIQKFFKKRHILLNHHTNKKLPNRGTYMQELVKQWKIKLNN